MNRQHMFGIFFALLAQIVCVAGAHAGPAPFDEKKLVNPWGYSTWGDRSQTDMLKQALGDIFTPGAYAKCMLNGPDSWSIHARYTLAIQVLVSRLYEFYNSYTESLDADGELIDRTYWCPDAANIFENPTFKQCFDKAFAETACRLIQYYEPEEVAEYAEPEIDACFQQVCGDWFPAQIRN